MRPLTCPVPSNINPLQSNGFQFAINKLPEVTFFCQEVTLPSIDLPAADMSSPLVDMPIPGDKLNFGELNIVFLIDEDMANFVAVHNWMVGLGFPRSHDDYKRFLLQNRNSLSTNELLAGYSDATLQVLDSSNNAVRTITFLDAFPTSLAQITLQSTTSDTQYLAASASFRFTLYSFI